jgi:ABC-type multidrug transport system ATPase subunit
VPEIPVLYNMLTVDEHMEFIARAYKLENWRDYSDELLSRFELDDKRNKLGKELSKGMQQKVSVCCALLPRPSSIIFDEPMIGLDPHAIRELKTVFNELKRDGCSLLISTHMIESMEGSWDLTFIMMNGRIGRTVRRDEALESLEDVFFEITEGAREK